MARGRMISKTLGHSRKFSALRHEAGRLGEFAQVLYPLLIANADALGRLAGDPFTVKHAVLPTSPRKEDDFAMALRAMDAVKLIEWYREGDSDVIQVRGFANHQDLRKEAQKSQFPEVSGKGRKLAEISSLIKLNSIQSKEDLRSPDAATGEGEISGKAIGDFLRRFCELYAKHRNGARYLVLKQKHVPNVKLLLSQYAATRLEKLAVVLLTTDDEWIAGTDRGIGILVVKASWLDGLLAGYEAKHGVIAVAS